jgi:hypothetical protein
MESVLTANGIAKEMVVTKSLLIENIETPSGVKTTVHQALCKWYNLLRQKEYLKKTNNWLFPEILEEDLLNSLQTDIELVPSMLMDEFISNTIIQDKQQYIRLVQAILINISDCLFLRNDEHKTVCNNIETTLEFMANFFYQQFDNDSRATKFSLQQFCDCFKLKLEYWQIKVNGSPLIEALKECVADNFILPENNITYRKINYLKYLLQEIESATTIITETYVRELFIYNNFNSPCFINYEIELIKTTSNQLPTNQEVILFLQSGQNRIANLKTKSGISFDPQQPSLKKQLSDWVLEEIKQTELRNRKVNDKDLLLDPESKIQTSLSVAKLAVLIRLMVVDKIIINKSVAPMLRTVTKLFTTLQKDEISFGSMETKYHAPDKATLNTMQEIMGKWINILGKL